MKAVVQHTYATTHKWQAANPKLYKGVWAFEITTDGEVLAKLGNGEHRWNDLKYFDAANIHGLPEDLQSLAHSIGVETGRATAAEQVLDGKITAEKNRATEAEQQLQQNINTEQARAQAVEQQLQQNIEHQETFHDNTLAGKGTAGDPLSVNLSLTPGINEGVTLTPDGVETTFPLPDNFVFAALSLVTINGLIQLPGADYTLDMDADTGSKTITFSEIPAAGDIVRAYFSASL